MFYADPHILPKEGVSLYNSHLETAVIACVWYTHGAKLGKIDLRLMDSLFHARRICISVLHRGINHVEKPGIMIPFGGILVFLMVCTDFRICPGVILRDLRHIVVIGIHTRGVLKVEVVKCSYFFIYGPWIT